MFFKKRKFIRISRVLKKSINLTDINFSLDNNSLTLNKHLKNAYLELNPIIHIKKRGDYISIIPLNKSKLSNALAGTLHSILLSIINGFQNIYESKLLLVGIGYKAILQYKYLYLYIGYTHPIIYTVPDDVLFIVLNFTEIIISSINKQKLNEVSSFLRNLKKPHPYKGTGIRYFNEKLNLKTFKKK